jgi:ankyrin repeat protein
MNATDQDEKLKSALAQLQGLAMFEDYELTAPESPGMDGNTPLHVISMDGRIDLLMDFLPFLKNIDVSDHAGYTPLYYAVIWSRLEMAKLLIDNGADPMYKNEYGDSPVEAMRSRPEFHSLLMDVQEKSGIGKPW